MPLWAVAGGLAAIFLFGALGLWWAEAVLVPATFLAAYAWWDRIAERVEAPLRGFGHRLGYNLLSFVRLSNAGVRTWWRRAEAVIRLRASQVPVRRRHERAIRRLGQAVFTGDEGAAESARAVATETGDQLDRLRRELERVRAEAERAVEQEHVASDATQEFRVTELASSGGGRSGDGPRAASGPEPPWSGAGAPGATR